MLYLFLLVSFLLAYITRPLFLNLLIDGKLLRPNYQKNHIPLGMGLYIFFNLALLWSLGYLMGLYPIQRFFPILLLAGVLSFLGFIDDLLGNRKAHGFIAHFRCLFNGKLTTGGLKALGAAIIVLVTVTYMTDTIEEIFISWLTLLLIINFINLLDLRPGRTAKVFSVSLVILFLFTWQLTGIWYLAIPLIPILFFYVPLDLEAEVMMGDTGSNLLGGILGYYIIQTVGFWGEVIILFSMILVHMYSERYSLSALIERNGVLNWLDQLGRKRIN